MNLKLEVPDEYKDYVDSLDDEKLVERVYVLVGDDIVCSKLLTERRSSMYYYCFRDSDYFETVEEESMMFFSEFRVDPKPKLRLLPHPELGNIKMYWELLFRSWERRKRYDELVAGDVRIFNTKYITAFGE